MAEPITEEGGIVEEREELMVPIGGGNPTLRIAHFLKPTVPTTKNPILIPPPPSSSLPTEADWALKVNFQGWQGPPWNWKKWLESMHSKYQSVWKKAGIYEAVMASKYLVHRNIDLVLSLAEKWCPETNTFVFPWAEAKVTSEDVMILGGLSVLGDPVWKPLETEDLLRVQRSSRKQLIMSKLVNAIHCGWMKLFMGSGSEFEHEAFLSLWLSRFVIPYSYGSVTKYVLPIAIHLARGTRIALAPLVNLYRDLRLLKEAIVASAELENERDDVLALSLFSPFQLVQLWGWERLPRLQPKPKFTSPGVPRSARWCRVKFVNPDIRLAIDSAGKRFQWRPYATAIESWSLSKFYKEKEEWVAVHSGIQEELESFARCLRASELVGMDSIERYLPHRVAMQFGMDQYLPDYVPHFDITTELAWNNYNRFICDERLYIPCQLFYPEVTTRYLKWWKQLTYGFQLGVVKKKRTPRKFKRLLKIEDGNKGVCAKYEKVEADKHTEVTLSRTKIKHNDDENQPASKYRKLVPSFTKNGTFDKKGMLIGPIEEIMQSEPLSAPWSHGSLPSATKNGGIERIGLLMKPKKNVF